MKNKLLILIFIILLLFCGCKPEDTATPLRDKFGDVMVENGEYFLRTYDMKARHETDIGTITMNCDRPQYDSVEGIKRRIKSNQFTNSEIDDLYHYCYTVPGDRELLPILDPDKMVIPALNGETNYESLGFYNRTFWCVIHIPCDDEKYYTLDISVDYEPTKHTESNKEYHEKNIQQGNYANYRIYTEDGITKQEWGGYYTWGDHEGRCYKDIIYETEINGITYFVQEDYIDDSLDRVALWGEVEGMSRFCAYIRCHGYDWQSRAMDKERVQWMMQSIELKKA